MRPEQVVVDLGYRGVDAENPNVEIIHRGRWKSVTAQQRRWLDRRQAVEPVVGHLKADHQMDRLAPRAGRGRDPHGAVRRWVQLALAAASDRTWRDQIPLFVPVGMVTVAHVAAAGPWGATWRRQPWIFIKYGHSIHMPAHIQAIISGCSLAFPSAMADPIRVRGRVFACASITITFQAALW